MPAEPVDPRRPNEPPHEPSGLLTQALLDPVSPDRPCGPDLEYDERFLALESAQAGQPERGLGQLVLPASPPNWPLVRAQAGVLATQTRDLRVGVILLRAWVHTEGETGLLAGLALLCAWVERYWAELHPTPDVGEADPEWPRAAALQPLLHADGLLRDIEPLVRRAMPADASWRRVVQALRTLAQAIDRHAPGLFEPQPLFAALAPWLEGEATEDRAPREPPSDVSPLEAADHQTLDEVRSWVRRVDEWAAAPEAADDQAQALRRWQREQAPELERLLDTLRHEGSA